MWGWILRLLFREVWKFFFAKMWQFFHKSWHIKPHSIFGLIRFILFCFSFVLVFAVHLPMRANSGCEKWQHNAVLSSVLFTLLQGITCTRSFRIKCQGNGSFVSSAKAGPLLSSLFCPGWIKGRKKHKQKAGVIIPHFWQLQCAQKWSSVWDPHRHFRKLDHHSPRSCLLPSSSVSKNKV